MDVTRRIKGLRLENNRCSLRKWSYYLPFNYGDIKTKISFFIRSQHKSLNGHERESKGNADDYDFEKCDICQQLRRTFLCEYHFQYIKVIVYVLTFYAIPQKYGVRTLFMGNKRKDRIFSWNVARLPTLYDLCKRANFTQPCPYTDAIFFNKWVI